MTIILTLANSEWAMQISDRRLSSQGKVANPQYNKGTIAEFSDGRFAVGFTGLATIGGFDTQTFILETLIKSGPPDGSFFKTIDRFVECFSNEFNSNNLIKKLPPNDRRLTVSFTGYYDLAHPPLLINEMITNFQNFNTGQDEIAPWDKFQTWTISEKEPRQDNPTYVQRIGAWPAFYMSDIDDLRNYLIEKKPRDAIKGKALSILRKLADRPEARESVGKDFSIITLYRDKSILPVNGYYPLNDEHIYSGVDSIKLNNNDSFCIKGLEIKVEGTQTTQKVGRNNPCWCKSGKKYKKCHGKRG